MNDSDFPISDLAKQLTAIVDEHGVVRVLRKLALVMESKAKGFTKRGDEAGASLARLCLSIQAIIAESADAVIDAHNDENISAY